MSFPLLLCVRVHHVWLSSVHVHGREREQKMHACVSAGEFGERKCKRPQKCTIVCLHGETPFKMKRQENKYTCIDVAEAPLFSSSLHTVQTSPSSVFFSCSHLSLSIDTAAVISVAWQTRRRWRCSRDSPACCRAQPMLMRMAAMSQSRQLD